MTTRKNLGMTGRMARIVIGTISLLIISLAFIGPKIPLAYLGALGIFPIITGIAGFCPPYALLGINTYRRKKAVNQ